MTEKQKKDWLILGGIGIAAFLLTRPGKIVTVNADFLNDAYRDMVTNGTMTFQYEGEPLYEWLAKNTDNWQATKEAYYREYNTNLDVDLALTLSDYQLSRFIFLLAGTGQTF